MKTVGKIIGGILILLILALIVLRITGLDPKGRRAGLWLSGTVNKTPVTDWSFTDTVDTIKIQTNTWFLLPHSVTIGCASNSGTLYLSSLAAKGADPYPGGKLWNRDVARDPHVRLKVGGQLYDVTLVYVTDQGEFNAAFQAMKRKYPHFNVPPGGSLNIFRVTNG
jgi:hypothetical protein